MRRKSWALSWLYSQRVFLYFTESLRASWQGVFYSSTGVWQGIVFPGLHYMYSCDQSPQNTDIWKGAMSPGLRDVQTTGAIPHNYQANLYTGCKLLVQDGRYQIIVVYMHYFLNITKTYKVDLSTFGACQFLIFIFAICTSSFWVKYFFIFLSDFSDFILYVPFQKLFQ